MFNRFPILFMTIHFDNKRICSKSWHRKSLTSHVHVNLFSQDLHFALSQIISGMKHKFMTLHAFERSNSLKGHWWPTYDKNMCQLGLQFCTFCSTTTRLRNIACVHVYDLYVTLNGLTDFRDGRRQWTTNDSK